MSSITSKVLKRTLENLGEEAIKNYSEDNKVTINMITLARNLTSVDYQIKKYIALIFNDNKSYFPFVPAIDSVIHCEEDPYGVDILFDIFQDEIFHELLTSVANEDLSRFVFICLNVGEIMKEIYCRRVEELRTTHAETMNLFGKIITKTSLTI